METHWIKVHFREALDELEAIVGGLEAMSESELEIALAHVYRHLNVGWSGRNDSKKESLAFPTELSVYWEA